MLYKSTTFLKCSLPKVGLVLLVLGILSSCASYDIHRQVQESIINNDFDVVVAKTLEESEKDQGVNSALQLLNLGMIYRIQGKYKDSTYAWQQAKKIISALRPTSISEVTTSFLVNDNTQSFTGSYLEQQWLYIFLALNYLDMQQPEDARVELLQAHQLHKEYGSDVIEPPFMRYLSGMVYEHLGEHDEALVAYRKALQVYAKAQQEVPRSLYTDTARMLHLLNQDDELSTLRKQHNISQDELEQSPNLTIVWTQGLVSQKDEQRLEQLPSELNTTIFIALPYYPPQQNAPQTSSITTQTGTTIDFLAAANLDESIRHEFSQKEDGLLYKTTARQVLKYQLTEALVDSNGSSIKGQSANYLIGSILNVVLESADIRSWNSLPYRVLLYRAWQAPGTRLSLEGDNTVQQVDFTHETGAHFHSFYRFH